jgi:hypothetical protein
MLSRLPAKPRLPEKGHPPPLAQAAGRRGALCGPSSGSVWVMKLAGSACQTSRSSHRFPGLTRDSGVYPANSRIWAASRILVRSIQDMEIRQVSSIGPHVVGFQAVTPSTPERSETTPGFTPNRILPIKRAERQLTGGQLILPTFQKMKFRASLRVVPRKDWALVPHCRFSSSTSWIGNCGLDSYSIRVFRPRSN